MADVTEKEQLLKRMKDLSDFISHAKQRDLEYMEYSASPKKTVPENHRQQTLGKQQQQQQSGSSTLMGTNSVSINPPSTIPKMLPPACVSTSTAGQRVSERTLYETYLALVQKKENTQSQKRNASQMVSSCKDLPVSSTSTQSLVDQREVVITRRIVASSSSDARDPQCAGKGARSILQSETRDRLNNQTTMPSKCTSAKVVQGVSSSGVKNRKHILRSPSSHSPRERIPSSSGGRQSQCASGQKMSVNQQCPKVQTPGVLKNVNSLRKDKLVSKNAQIVAAREVFENSIKSLQAEVEAVKKRKNKPAELKREVTSMSFKPELCNEALPTKTVQSDQMKALNKQKNEVGATDRMKRCSTIYLRHIKGSKDEPHTKTQSSDHLIKLKGTHKDPSGKTMLAKQDSVAKKEVCLKNQLNDFTRLLPLRSETLSPSSVNTAMEKALPPELRNFSDSKSKSVDKADLERKLKVAEEERKLKVAEEKLQATRKRMGIMLKESPQKSDQSTSDKRSHQQLQQPPSRGNSVVHPKSMPTSTPHAKKRLFPNRRSLKWTPQKSPQTSENVLVIGSSLNMRTFAPDRTLASTRGQRQTPRRRKSQLYSIVRNNSTPVAKKPVTQVQGPLDSSVSSKSFVSRYKVQRINSGTETAASIPKKTVVQSRYKLTKFVAKDMPRSPAGMSGLSTPLSAKQKAAQIIKSKYKLRTVPLSSPHISSAMQTNQHKYWSSKQCATNNFFGYSPSVQSVNRNKHNQVFCNNRYNFPHTFPSVRAVPGRGYPGQRMNSPAYFQARFWTGGFGMHNPLAGWGIQSRRSPRLQSKMQRAMAVKVWKQQWKQQWQWAGMPYNQMAGTMQMRRWRQLQIHLKRQQWKNTMYNLRKQSHPSSQNRRNVLARREHLVMINGTVYKSSSRRLTKASSSDPVAKLGIAGTSAVASSGFRRNGKWPRMQTVMVRGVRYQVNARGTRLQRMANSTKKGKVTAFSKVDIRAQTQRASGSAVDIQTRYVINRVKQRSILLAAAKSKKKADKDRKKKNCLYFSRFGKCSRGEACPFIHDPAKVAVCTRFLRGTCQVENCPFSHNVSKEKMPVCAFFLKGVCTREPCPYLHVKVSQGAEVCQDFISGFCPLADKCQKLHTLTCPHFARTGSCPDGKKCRLQHRKHRAPKTQRVRLSSGSTHTPKDSVCSAKHRKRSMQSDERQESQNDREDCSPPASKRFRPDFSGQSEPQMESYLPLWQTMPETSAVTVDPKSVESAGTGETAECGEVSERGKGFPSQRKLLKLPAFISLADYSFEESPVPKAKKAKYRASTLQKKGQDLQIKPQL